MSRNRREFMRAMGAVAAAGIAGVPMTAKAASGRVVVIGGGFGGATAAKYLKLWSTDLDVTLVERDAQFISCPLSNRILAGTTTLADLTRGYGDLSAKYGVKVLRDEATAVDPAKQTVTLASGKSLPYDRLILSPGVDLDYSGIAGLKDEAARERVLAAWKAGPQTVALRRQIESMADGGVVAITVPKVPYRCPPGPYERACQIAWYLKLNKPKSKVLILDANEKVVSKEALFRKAWEDLYPGLVEYVPNSELADVDATTLTAKLQFDEVKADVLNVIPPMKAAAIAERAGLITANNKWCGIDFLTYESTAQKNIHVLGDAIVAAPLMPKSGHMANQHAKICAAAVIALLRGDSVNAHPVINNTCYSFVTGADVIHIASVHQYDAEKKTMLVVPGSGGLSIAPNELEGRYAEAWGRNIWSDMLG
ncbi:MAG: FCSD flavin-binding domain-containing protein [Burkholderiales bacterium]|nr:FCSD flavin-binding domain-containing protein [Burkholderiales bacterium]